MLEGIGVMPTTRHFTMPAVAERNQSRHEGILAERLLVLAHARLPVRSRDTM